MQNNVVVRLIINKDQRNSHKSELMFFFLKKANYMWKMLYVKKSQEGLKYIYLIR